MVETAELVLFFVFGFLLLSVISAATVDSFRISVVHFSSVAIAVGLLFAAFITVCFPNVDLESLRFADDIFFKFVLPIIVFAAGFTLDTGTFFGNFRVISLLGILGTFINWLFMGLLAMAVRDLGWVRNLAGDLVDFSNVELLLFCATMASTDTVAVVALLDPTTSPILYAVLAGEGIVNDGVSVVLYRSVLNVADDLQKGGGDDEDMQLSFGLFLTLVGEFCIVFLASLAIGALFGLLSALYAKWQRERPPVEIEVTILVLFGATGYYLTEALGFSGIIALFVCGMVMSRYTVWNLTHSAQFSSFNLLNSMSYAMQTLIFTSLGFFAWGYALAGGKNSWTLGFAAAMIGVIVLLRIVYVTLLMLPGNAGKPKRKRLDWKQQVVTIYGGCVRGVIAFALAHSINTEHRSQLLTSTYIIVMFTTVVFGAGCRPVFTLMGVGTTEDETEHATLSFNRVSQRKETGQINDDDDFDYDYDDDSGALYSEQPLLLNTTPTAASSTDADVDCCHNLREQWKTGLRRFDRRLMQPVFGGPNDSEGDGVATAPSADPFGTQQRAADQTGLTI